jgi:hypothetical protein
MDKYFKGYAKATAQGTEQEWKLKAENEEKALFLFADKAMEHIEQYDNPELIQEESGVEYEYNYHVTEITKEEYEASELEELC